MRDARRWMIAAIIALPSIGFESVDAAATVPVFPSKKANTATTAPVTIGEAHAEMLPIGGRKIEDRKSVV